MKLDVIGFGALNMDKLYRVNRIAGEGEESFITSCTESPGGSAANTIVGLSRLGIKTGCVGKLSQDREGRLLLQDLLRENVDIGGIIRSSEGRSGVVFCFVDRKGERAMYVSPGVNDDLKLKEIDLEYCRNTKFLHLTSFIGEKPFEAQKQLLKKLSGVKVSLDTGMHYAVKGLEALRPIISRCYLFLSNEMEIRLLTGKNYTEASGLLIREGVEIVAVKLGARGCYVTDGVEEHFIDAYKVKAVDTTGAGDAFCAGFLYGLINGRDLYDCGVLGNYVASCKIGKEGAREGLPRRTDLPIYLKE